MFTSKTTSTPKYIKSKAYGLIGTIALFTSLAFLMGPGVSADEVTPVNTPTIETVAPAVETPETPAVTSEAVTSEAMTSEAVTSETITSEAVTSEAVTSEAVTSEAITSEAASSEAVTSTASSETATSEAATSETATSETTDPNVTTTTTTPAYPTETPQPVYTKTGTTITVQNPDIHIDFTKGHGIYATNTFVFHAQFEDNFAINDGDQFVLTLPKEMTFPTSTKFPVTNEAGETIGQASTNVTTNAVTVTFNDYLQKHPENKFLNLAFDQKWTAYVKDNTTFTTSVKGTLLKIAIAKEIAQQDGTRKFAKWGIQSKDDPTIIDWTLQLNYGNLWSNQVLTNFQLLDTLGPDQVLLEDSIRAEHITNVTPYVSKGDVMNELLDLKTNPKGFSFKIANLNKMIYVWYKSKLTKPVSESYNPTNRADYIFDNMPNTIVPYNATATLSGGRGDGGGKNRPVVETPLVPSETPSQSLSTSESPKSETSSETAKSEGNSTSSSEAFSEGNSTSSSEAPKSETTSEGNSTSSSETPKSETTSETVKSEGNSTSSSEAPKSETTSETVKSEGNSTSSSEAPKSETTSETVKSEVPKSETHSETVKSEGNSTSSSEAPKSKTTSETVKSEGDSTSSSEAPKSETTSETVKSEGNSTSSSESPKSETTSETAKSEGNSTSSSEAPKSETTSETIKSETPKSETTSETIKSETPKSETTSEAVKSEGNSTSSSEAPKSETTSETVKSEGNSTSSSEAHKSETTSETVKSEGNSTSSSETPKSETSSKGNSTSSSPKSETATAIATKTLPETGENNTLVILNYILSVLTLGASLTLFVTTLKKKK